MNARAYKNYVVAVLLVIYAFNAVDRLALGIILQSIKADLALTDTQLGLLTGIAFALFYSVMGIPIARWADRGNRVLIIALSAALWSIMVVLCGFAASFAQLLLIRVGVAIGEAGCLPAAHSLIPDYYSRAERPRAVAVYMLGASMSVILGYFLSGWLNQLYGWRTTFVLLGWPGFMLAAVAWFTVREPRLSSQSQPDKTFSRTSQGPAAPSLSVVCTTLWRNVTFRHLLLSFSVISFFGNGIGQWQAAFFVRSFGLKTGELGTWFALIYGVGGLLGTYLGGELASRYAANNERRQLRTMGVAFGSFGLISALIYLTTSRVVAFSVLGAASLGVSIVTGPLFATIQTLVPERMRAMAVAALYLFANLIGMGLGPLAAGALSDVLRPWLRDDSLRYALLILSPGYLWGAWHLWRAGKTVMQDLEISSSEHHGQPTVERQIVSLI